MIRIGRSAVVDAPVEQVWPLVRDFGGWETWHAAVASLQLEGAASDVVGAVRRVRLSDGTHLREQLIALSDRWMICQWCLVEASVALDGYVGELRIRRVTHGALSFVQMGARLDGSSAHRGAAERLVGDGLLGPALSGLQARFRPAPMTSGRLAGSAHPRPVRQHAGFPAISTDHQQRREPIGTTQGFDQREPRRPHPAAGVAAPETPAIVVEQYGGPEVLRTAHVPVLPPGRGEVRLRHAYIGVNMIDLHGRAGEFGLGPLPAVPGMEAAGTVVDVGSGVTHIRAGDRVVYAGRPPGAYAALRTLSADIVVPLPVDIDERTAAASFLKGVTADMLLRDVHPLRAGESVLVHAAAGGLGLLLCAWARSLGARVIGVVSSDDKVDAAAPGCDAVIVSSREDVAATVRDVSRGRGVDVVYDAVGGSTFDASLASLAPRGHLVSFGQASGPVGARDIDALASRSIRLSRPNFVDYTDTPAALQARADRVFAALRAGRIRPAVDSEWPLEDAASAHRRVESRASIGSVLLKP